MSHLSLHSADLKTTRQGSSLMVVMLVMFVISIVAASLLSLGNHEKNLTYRRVSDIEAKHVVESALELAVAELENHFAGVQSVTAETPALQLSAAQKNLLLNNARYVQDVRIVSVNNHMLRQRVYVDVYDPTTQLDPHRGTHVNVSEWEIIAEVDVEYRGHTRSVRAKQNFQVRESPFFNFAILYNMDLEFHPGPSMVINGPVHSNGIIWAVAQSSLHFLDRVSATQGIHVGGMMDGQQQDWGSGYLDNQGGDKVWFNTNGRRPSGAKTNTDHSRVFANLWDGKGGLRSASSYYDNRSEASGKLSNLGFSSMGEFLANWFDGNVATGSTDAPVIRPKFIPQYVADDGSGNRLNHGYALIEPLLPPLGGTGNQSALHKGEGEREKYAFKAGLSFEVRYLPGVDPLSTPEHWRQLWEPGFTPVLRSELAESSPHATYDFSNMSEGDLDGQAGFVVEEGNIEYEVDEDGLSYSNGEISISGNTHHVAVSQKKDDNRAYVSFPALDGEAVYFSYLVEMQAESSKNTFFMGMSDSLSGTGTAGFQAMMDNAAKTKDAGFYVQTGSNLAQSSGRTQSPKASIAPDNKTTYLLVGRLLKTDPTGTFNRAELLVNPSTLETPTSGWVQANRDTGIREVSTLFFRADYQGASSGYRVGSIRIGDSYESVIRNPPDMTGATDYWIIPQKVRRSNAHNLDTTDFSSSPVIPLFDDEGDPLLDDEGQPVTQTILSTVHDPVYIAEGVFHDVFRARIYREDAGGNPVANGGLYDKRDLKPQDLIAVNMAGFKNEIIETSDTERFTQPLEGGGGVLTYTPSNEFNGVTYFQFPLEDEARPDNIVVARNNFRPVSTAKVDNQAVLQRQDHTSLSLFIHNAKEIPNPDYNASRSPGFTLATNSRLYLHGSYNADGVASTGSSTTGAGEPSEYNALAALAADAVTFLSGNFSEVSSKRSSRPAASFTEVNAALMYGILPTNSTGLDTRYSARNNYPISGGSHNYHRFLENWSGIRFRYRGSLVAFFESELARSPQEQNNNTWYGAPIREYGFYDIFGTGAQPPGTPMARTFFKLDFSFD